MSTSTPLPDAPESPLPAPAEPRWLTWCCMGLSLATIAIVAWWGLSFQAVAIWDAADLMGPNFILTGDLARQGQMAHWDPWTSSGVPLGVDFSVRSPLVVFAAMVLPPGEWSYRFFVWFCWIIGALGMWVLARRLGTDSPTSAISMLALFGAGFMTAHVSQPPLFIPILWTTWALAVIEQGLRTQSLKFGFFAGAVLGIIALMSYPGLLPVVLLITLAYAALRALYPTGLPPESPLGKRLLFVAASSALASITFLIITSPTLLGYLFDTADYTVRAGALDRTSAIMDNRFTPQALASALSPAIPQAAIASQQPAWAITDVTGIAGYLSPVLLAMLLWILFYSRRQWLALILIALALLALMTAMPDLFPVRAWLYDYCPPFRYFRHASIFLGAYAFLLCLALPIAQAASHASQRPHSRFWRISFAIALIVIALTWLIALYAIFQHLGAPPRYTRNALVILAVVLLGVSIGLFLLRTQSQAQRRLGLLLLVAMACLDTLYHFSAMDRIMLDRNPSTVARWAALQEKHEPSLDLANHTSLQRAPRQDLDNQHLLRKIPVIKGYTALGNPVYDHLIAKDAMRAALCSPNRIYFSPAPFITGPVTPENQAATVSAIDHFFTVHPQEFPAIIVPAPSATLTPSPVAQRIPDPLAPFSPIPPAEHIPFELVAYTPTNMTLRLLAPQDGWVIVTDRFSPGWHATIDNQPAPIHRALLVFRAIPVHQGENLLEMRYRSFGHPWLTILSWSCLAAAVGFAIFTCFRPHRSSHRPDPESAPSSPD